MKWSVCALAILFPALSWAELAGDWMGTIDTPYGVRRIVLHISGPDTALKATSDSPDQHQYDVRIDSISFSDSTLRYSIPPYDIEYSGVLNSDGKIAGTMTQHGGAVSLVLARSNDAARVLPPAENLASGVVDGKFHHEATGWSSVFLRGGRWCGPFLIGATTDRSAFSKIQAAKRSSSKSG